MATVGRATANPPPSLGRFLAMAAVVAGWVFLMTWRLQATTLQIDEYLTAYRTVPGAPLWDAMHPESYYAYMRGWASLFGSSDASLRLAALPWALLAVVCVAIVAWWLLPWPGPLVAVALVGLSSELPIFWRMARYFGPVAGSFAIVVLATVGFLRTRRAGWLAVMAGGTVLCGYCDYLPCLSTLLPWGWVLVGEARRKRGDRHLAAAVVALAAAGLCLLPAMTWAVTGAGRVSGSPLGHLSAHNTVMKAGMAFWSLLASEVLPPWQAWAALVAIAGSATLLVAGAVAAWRAGGAWRLVLFVWPTALAAAWLALDFTPGEPPVRISSLALHGLPWALLVMALGWSAFRSRWWATAALCLALAGQVVGLHNYFTRTNYLNPQYAMSWQEVADYLRPHVHRGDAMVTFFDAGIYRYFKAPCKTVLEAYQMQHGGMAKIAKVLASGHSVWLISRERGSALARGLAQAARKEMVKLGATETAHGFMPYGHEERIWRSALTHAESGKYYLTVYQLRRPTRAASHASAGRHGPPATHH